MIWIALLLMTVSLVAQQPNVEVSGYDCGDCHGSEGWAKQTYTGFSHQMTGFKLEGAHKSPACDVCHTGNTLEEKHQFQNVANTCSGCHLDVHQATLGEECTSCHDFMSWQVTQQTFDHATTRFPLEGAHHGIACEKCHTEKPMTRFDFIDTDCYSCHKNDFNEALNPSHVLARFDRDCRLCHSDQRTGWRPTTYNHADTGYPLTGLHIVAACNSCHIDGQFAGTPTSCEDADCHFQIYQSTTKPSHTEYGYPLQNCVDCHVTLGWSPVNYDHSLTLSCNTCHLPDYQNADDPVHSINSGFSTNCDECHTSVETWEDASFSHANIQAGTCGNCHMDQYNATTSPNHQSAGYSTTCDDCHKSTSDWNQVQFDHSQTSETCSTCHMIDYNNTANSSDPGVLDHGGFNFSTDCTSCHNSTTDWQQVTFDHTQVPTTPCSGCHISDYTNLPNDAYPNAPNHIDYNMPTECILCHSSVHSWAQIAVNHDQIPEVACVACHLADFNGTTDPDHAANGYTTDCTQCHVSTTDWGDVNFDHGTVSVPCADCHMPDFNGTANSSNPDVPDHVASGYTTDCTQCHSSTSDWLAISFDHNLVTVPCADCHMPDFNGTANSSNPDVPDHVASGYTTDCTQCHSSTTDWLAISFDHNLVTVPCSDCHMPEYNGTSNSSNPDVPDHVSSGYTTDCTQCHSSTTDWLAISFDHNLVTVPCADCHMPEYNDLPNTTYPNAPNHVDLNLPTDCTLCHNSTSDWTQVTFNHDAVTAIACSDCHMPEYNDLPNTTYPNAPNHAGLNLPTDCTLCHNSTSDWTDETMNHTSVNSIACVDCHQSDYDNTTNPNHNANGYSTVCQTCHGSVTSWTENVTFDHTNISQPCWDCHQSDYNSANHHSAQQYPTSCGDCHTTTYWSPADFNHDNQWFPIYSGEHNNRWSTCTAECHMNASDFSVFGCGLNGICHAHNQSSMDSEHSGEVSNYVYSSDACYNCHPNGTEGDDGGDDIIKKWRQGVKRIIK